MFYRTLQYLLCQKFLLALLNRQLLNHFEKERVGLQFLSLANGHPTGFYGKLEVGTVSDKVKTKTQEIMTDFFKLTNET